MIMCYLVSQMTVYTFEYYENDEVLVTYAVYQSLVVMNCFWWSSIIIVQAYEWNLIASMVRHQSKFDLTEMGV
jgi:uncharacterized membrane protein